MSEKRKQKYEEKSGNTARANAMFLTGDQLMKAQKGAGVDLLNDTNDRDVYVEGEEANVHKMVNVDPRYLETKDYENYIPSMINKGIKPLGNNAFTDEQIQQFIAQQKALPREDMSESDEEVRRYHEEQLAKAKAQRAMNQDDPRNYSKLMNLMKK